MTSEYALATELRDSISRIALEVVESYLAKIGSPTKGWVNESIRSQLHAVQVAATGGTTSGGTALVLATTVLPGQSVGGVWYLSGSGMWTGSVGTDDFEVAIDCAAVAIAGGRVRNNTLASNTLTPHGFATVNAGESPIARLTIQRLAGTGTATVATDYRYSRLDGIFIPS
jgi:hypothetical protein